MNQVMINAVDLDMMVKEIKDLKEENFRLKKLLADEYKHVELLKNEVAWAENGYTTKGDTP
jgi:predicted RNase H-like nuclease (RuvC/YqgF family)